MKVIGGFNILRSLPVSLQGFNWRSWFSVTCILISLFLLSCPRAEAVSLPDGPQIGQLAPRLNLSTWLQAPPEAANGWPTGKVVVLEFWATGCGPCVANIPHLNQLVAEFKGKPVQFAAVTDEEESVIRRFLKERPMDAWIGLGAEAGFGETTPYKVQGIPHIVIIDAHGRIAAIPDASSLSPAMIQTCLDGRTPQMEFGTSGRQLPGLVPGQYQAGIIPMFQVMIRPFTNSTSPAAGDTPGLSPSSNHRHVETWRRGEDLTLQGDSLQRAIEVVFDVKPTRIVAEAKLPGDKYDFYITLPSIDGHPQKQTTFEGVFAQAVLGTFGLTVQRETQDVEALALRTNALSLAALSASTDAGGQYVAFCNEAAATNQPLSALAEELEVSSARPVLDETGLTNHFDFDIKWKQKDYSNPNIEGMIAAVKKLGLDLVPVKKRLEVIVVRPAP